MLALSLSLMVLTAQLPSSPPMVSGEVAASGRGARLLDSESQAKLASLDARAAALKPSAERVTIKTFGIISASLALLPVAVTLIGAVVGIVLGAAGWGFLGALAGFIGGAAVVIMFIPWPVWVAAAALAITTGVLFAVEGRMGGDTRREMDAIRAERRAILHPTPMTTVVTF